MPHAAIYVRRSTKQDDRAESAKSVTLQREEALAFAAKKGWTVLPEHIYVDDGVSGSRFETRPGFMRLMAALEPHPPFSVLLVSEQKSVGRHGVKVPWYIHLLAEAGVEVFEYIHGQSLTPKNAMERMVSGIQAGVDEMHREQTSIREKRKLTALATKGFVVGGRCYGYKNVHIYAGVDQHGNPLRSHVDREKVPEEEAAILRAFELYASGLGLRSIARQLNAEAVPKPKYSRRRPGDTQPADVWFTSTIRALLRRELYRGIYVWDKGGIRVPREDLRIVPEDLWSRVQARRRATEGRTLRLRGGRLGGRPPKGETKNLLAGMALCGVCHRGLVVEPRAAGPRQDAFDDLHLPAPGEPLTGAGRKEPYHYYTCWTRRHAREKCSNALRIRVEVVNEAVLQAIEEHVFTPEAVEKVIQSTERDEAQEQRERMEIERADIERRLRKLREAIEVGGDAPTLVARIRELDGRRQTLLNQEAGLRRLPRPPAHVVETRLADWRKLLRASTTQGRAVLEKVIPGRIVFTPRSDGEGFDFAAVTTFERIFAGVAVPQPSYVKTGTRGTEHIGPEDTFDADFGQLLARAQRAAAAETHPKGKLKRARRESNPLPLGSKPSALSR